MKKGDIVTVLLEDCLLCGCQGEVVHIENDGNPEGPIGVRFGKQYAHLFGCDFDPMDIIRFEEHHLRVDADYTLENKANMLFFERWHSACALKDPLDVEKLCMHRDCLEKRKRRIMINAWGCVQEIDVCHDHAEKYHGAYVEMFPFRD